MTSVNYTVSGHLLRPSIASVYSNFAPAKSGDRISTLIRSSAQALYISAFFVPKIRFYGGLCGGASARRFLDHGSTNSAQSATLSRLVPDGGSSLHLIEDTTHV